jgi:hypothetical protein
MEERLTLKAITQKKKNMNWGEIPPFFHMVSNTLSDLEGISVHGFDNAFRRIIKKNNWNLNRLRGERKLGGEVSVARKPELVVHRRFVGNNYEVHCMPEVNGEPVVLYKRDDPNIDFEVWDPSTMQCLIKLPDFIEFIRFAYTRGDEIDKLLVMHASNTVDKILLELATDIEIKGLKGYSIKHIVERVEEEGTVL